MPFFFPGSSELTIAPPSPAVIDKLAELSADEPLPEIYKSDRIRLLVQSPRKLYLYWQLARDPFEALRRSFGMRATQYSLMVRLVATDNDDETLHEASPTRSQWFDAQPAHSYRADVGLYSAGRGFIRLLSSNVAQTPRSGVASAADTQPEWSVSAEEFARVLDESGYVSDAFEVTLEAADAVTQGEATRTVARRFAGTIEPPVMDETGLAELRGLLTALAFGVSFDNLRGSLSKPFANWLEQAGAGEGVDTAVNASRLLKLLQSTLGIEMSRAPFDGPTEQAMRRAARVMVGASEVNLPERPFHLWLPSMTAGMLKEVVNRQ
ncbi:MAG: DUF4912 domain-containing protein [Pyrinomonadaceae bacterium]